MAQIWKKVKNIVDKTLRKILHFKYHILISLAPFVLAFAGTELMLRLNSKSNTLLQCRQEDRELHHGLIPNSSCIFKTGEWNITYRVNSLGLRDDEVLPKAEGEFRILVLGDSFVEGYGVDEQKRFTELLEKKLREGGYENVRIVNAGIASYSPILEFNLLEKIYKDVNPDLILAGLDMTDFFDEVAAWNFYYAKQPKQLQETDSALEQYGQMNTEINAQQKEVREFRAETRWLEPEREIPFKDRIKMFMRRSKLYVMVTNIVKDLMNNPYLADGSPAFITGDIDTDLFAIVRDSLPAEKYSMLWNLPRLSLEKLKSFGQENEVAVAFFTYPHGMQVDGQQWGKGRLTRGFVRGQVYSNKPLTDLETFGQENDVPVLNLYGDMFNNRTEKLYFDWDGHFNNRGHEVVAQGLAGFLLGNNMLNRQ